MENVHCKRCGASWSIPTDIGESVRREIASLLRNNEVAHAIKRLREVTGLGLADAKAVELHITREAGKCQWCGSSLPGGAAVICQSCQSLNYDW